MVAMDPLTGRVVAMVGGFSFDQSQFNRATQAYRQPGSTFKPLVYSAAMDNGYTPATIMIDGPIEIDQGQGNGVWRPENFSVGSYRGPITLREALKQSLNTVTVRLAQDVGMPLIGEYAKRFGVYEELPNYLSYSLGAGETTVMRMVTAYSMFANGGRRVKPTLIDRIQDRYGRTIFKHDARECRGCDAPGGWKNQPEPQLVDRREQVLDSLTAYQITSMLEGVVQGGTASVMREVGKPIAGKTGTTSDGKDVWFIGFSPDLVVGLYLGYDKPRSLGRAAQGGHTAAPIVKDFMKLALANKPATPFKIPAGIRLVRVDAKSGTRPSPAARAAARSWKRSSRAPCRRIITPSLALPTRMDACHRKSRPTPAISFAPEPAGFITVVAIALCGVRRYIRSDIIYPVAVPTADQRDHARRSRTPRRRDQAVSRAAEEASLTSRHPRLASPS